MLWHTRSPPSPQNNCNFRKKCIFLKKNPMKTWVRHDIGKAQPSQGARLEVRVSLDCSVQQLLLSYNKHGVPGRKKIAPSEVCHLFLPLREDSYVPRGQASSLKPEGPGFLLSAHLCKAGWASMSSFSALHLTSLLEHGRSSTSRFSPLYRSLWDSGSFPTPEAKNTRTPAFQDPHRS